MHYSTCYYGKCYWTTVALADIIADMNLKTYFLTPGSLTVSQLRVAIGARSDAQLRQWQHAYKSRKPGPAYCIAIERATGGLVTRQDLRPVDYHLIWPDLLPVSTQE